MATLKKYNGVWDEYSAAHLLRRTTYGVDFKTIKDFGKKSLDECIETLFSPQALPDPPINYNYTDDPTTPVGDTWVNKLPNGTFNFYRGKSLKIWSLELLLTGMPNIREKMTMFWHNHFVTSNISDPRFSYTYISKLRSSALGNFRQLTKDITIDPAMLVYLNGKDSTGKAPNENFGRELLELFTMGKGDLVGPGDYSTYTEEDVKQMARGFTGWVNTSNSVPPQSEFRVNRHDKEEKILSHRFGNAVIPNANEDEYKNLIDVIFQQEAVAEFIATKLYRWFVYFDIDEDIKLNIIKPLADIIRKDDYEIMPALKVLLSSDHFYEACIRGRMIKNPVDFLINPINQFEVAFPDDVTLKVRVIYDLYNLTVAMRMAIFLAPSVGGWAPFYQEPAYYRLWLNAVSLTKRKIYTDALTSTGFNYGKAKLIINHIYTISLFDNPKDEMSLLDQYALILFSKPLADNQKDTLKGFLNTGSEGEWKKVYSDYITNQSNQNYIKIINKRLQSLVKYMMLMPEYHLC